MAAETASEYSEDPWVLYVRELEFVAAHTGGSIDAAEEVLLDGLRERSIDWICWRLDYGDGCDFDRPKFERVCKRLLQAGIGGEGIEGYLGRALQFFWQGGEHTRITVHRATSSATRTGPPWAVKSHFRLDVVDGKLDPVEDCCPVYFLDFPPVTLTAELIRLRHEQVVAKLRFIGLLPPQPAQRLATPAEPAAESTQPQPEPEVAAEAADTAAVDTTMATAKRKKKAQLRIAEAAKKIYPPDGIVPSDIDPADLKHAIEALDKREAEERSAVSGKKEKPPAPPSWSSCKRFLEDQRGA